MNLIKLKIVFWLCVTLGNLRSVEDFVVQRWLYNYSITIKTPRHIKINSFKY